MKKETQKTKLPKKIDDKIKLLIYDAELIRKKVSIITLVQINNPKHTKFGGMKTLIFGLLECHLLSEKIINRLVVHGDLEGAIKFHNKLRQTEVYKLSINQIMKGEF